MFSKTLRLEFSAMSITLALLWTILSLSNLGYLVMPANADPNPDFLTRFTIDCGSAGSFKVGVNNHAVLPKPIFVLDDTTVFRIASLSIQEVNNGEPLFYASGLFNSDVDLITCHFIGSETGRHFTVVGFFTPAS